MEGGGAGIKNLGGGGGAHLQWKIDSLQVLLDPWISPQAFNKPQERVGMLIVMEHHRDAKEGKYGAGDPLKCKSGPTDHHMLNVGRAHLVSIGSSWQHPHTWIQTYYKTPLISVSLAHFEGKSWATWGHWAQAQNTQHQLQRKCTPKRDCVPALTLLKMYNLQA